jgi:hypothetical protein
MASSRASRGVQSAKRFRAGRKGPVRRGSVGPKSAMSGLPSAAAACIGPVSFVTIKSQSRSHSTISGREVSPHKFRHRSGAAREMISPSGRSPASPRMAKRAGGNFSRSGGQVRRNFPPASVWSASARRAGGRSIAERGVRSAEWKQMRRAICVSLRRRRPDVPAATEIFVDRHAERRQHGQIPVHGVRVK